MYALADEAPPPYGDLSYWSVAVAHGVEGGIETVNAASVAVADATPALRRSKETGDSPAQCQGRSPAFGAVG